MTVCGYRNVEPDINTYLTTLTCKIFDTSALFNVHME